MFHSVQSTDTLPTFADITTIGIGGSIASFVCPTDRVGVIEAVEGADTQGIPLCVIGGGSNILASDECFSGVVVRDARQTINILDEAAPVEGQDKVVHVAATAGTNWDDFVVYCISMGLSGLEGLSGIPGTVGASVVQNIGAYGQEVSQCVDSVEVWDRQLKTVRELSKQEMAFGYRTSALKASMYWTPGVPENQFFPTPRYVVLSVTFAVKHSGLGRIDSEQLAQALGAEIGAQLSIEQIRKTVQSIRARKGMLEDPSRYNAPWMQGTRQTENIRAASIGFEEAVLNQVGGNSRDDVLSNRHSCGSFFMNPVLNQEQANQLPAEAPRYPVMENGIQSNKVKTSAAWLIDNAGFHKGFCLPGSSAALSSVHTLSLTNRGGASAKEVRELAVTIQDTVRQNFGVNMVPEPVLVSANGSGGL